MTSWHDPMWHVFAMWLLAWLIFNAFWQTLRIFERRRKRRW